MRRAVDHPTSQVRLSENLIAPPVSSCKNIHMPLSPWHRALLVGAMTVQNGGPLLLRELQYLLLESGAPTKFMEPTQTSPRDTFPGGREHLA